MAQIIGIDFGTKQLTGSALHDGNYFCRKFLDPEHFIPQNFQQFKKYSDFLQVPGWRIHKGLNPYPKNYIKRTAEILSFTKKNMEQILQNSINEAVIAVPAYFDDTVRHIILKAAEIVGFKVN